MQGDRLLMEDSVCAAPLRQDGSVLLFALLDGHGGDYLSKHVAKTLPGALAAALKSADTPDQIQSALVNALCRFDDSLLVELGGLAEDQGTTITGAVVTPTHIIVFNLGDSKTVFIEDERIRFVTKDHKPTDPEEADRIFEAGLTVKRKRVNGKLDMSRSLGDFRFKQRELHH